MAKAWIGCSGYQYRHWKDSIYPKGLPLRAWFEYYASVFDTVEINATFYGLPRVTTTRRWAAEARPGFEFVLKGSRFITHIKKLADPSDPVRRFAERIEPVISRTRVILWQLPPTWSVDIPRLEAFLKEVAHNAVTRRTHHAFEFRHETWYRDETYRALRRHNAGLVLADQPWQMLPPGGPDGSRKKRIDVPLTTRWVYVRRHGPTAAGHGAGYSPALLEEDAARMRGWLDEGRTVYVYYNNDVGGHAWRDALALRALLGEEKEERPPIPSVGRAR